VRADLAEKIVERNAKIQFNLQGAILLAPGISEKIVHRKHTAVPRTNTGVLAEKAKTCKGKLVKGIRHIRPVT